MALTPRRDPAWAFQAYRPEATVNAKGEKIEDLFGANVFTLERMRERLPKAVYKQLLATIRSGEAVDHTIGDAVAIAMRDWAVDHGATHYTHWFQPLTGLTAEKHDSFITPTVDGRALQEFSGKDLIKGEPDASSLPSGGLRTTFEARGYTAWDPTSPAFIVENPNGTVLCIPTAFCAYTGEALDKKTPLMRSMEALSRQARRALALFGADAGVQRVTTTVGSEQEYFLIPRGFYQARPDLLACGRTLVGAAPAKGQELEDHYFGQIPDRVLAFMLEAELELYKLGVPVSTRHNEVAPAQYEIAPIFEDANVANDHQQLVMIVLQRLAPKHGLEVLLHEKPFNGVNGSGKHNNWSMSTDTGVNLLDPGESPGQNMQFMFFCTAVIRAVYRYGGLLRTSVASAGNDHRLGANEAPPAIMSVFLGEQLHEIYRKIEQQPAAQGAAADAGLMGLGVNVLPPLPKDTGDRNRTSPFAFTGNKFEFRAMGSNQSIAGPNVILNTIVAESIDHMAGELEKRTTGGESLEDALRAVIREVMRDEGAENVLFEGDNYSAEWEQEAAKRGLDNLRDTVESQENLLSDRHTELFEGYGVLSSRELASRFEIYTEQYVKTINIEAETLARLARTQLLPAALKHQQQLAETVRASEQAGGSASGARRQLDRISALVDGLDQALGELVKVNDHESPEKILDHARYMRDTVIPAMHAVREQCDAIERVLPDELYPMPTYTDMLLTR